jgi:hypothetical protein
LSKEISDFFGTDSVASSCPQPYIKVGDRKGNRTYLILDKRRILFRRKKERNSKKGRTKRILGKMGGIIKNIKWQVNKKIQKRKNNYP